MWRVWNKLLGWHYVRYRFGGEYVAGRIRRDSDGVWLVKVCCIGWEHLSYVMTRRDLRPLTQTKEEFNYYYDRINRTT